MGLTRVARLAGNQVAIRAAAARTSGAAVNATGSNAPTSYKIPLRALAVAIESNSPITTQLTNMMDPSRMIIRNTVQACAPSAIRMPISRVRRATE